MMRITPWHRRPSSAAPYVGELLVCADVSCVPLILADLEARKTRALWVSDEDFATGYDALCKQEVALLMDAREDIIREIRGVRGSWENLPTDLESYPVGAFPGVQLQGIEQALISNSSGDSAAKLLEDIKGLLASQATADTDQVQLLAQIAALLAV